jgi:hypothetical protein
MPLKRNPKKDSADAPSTARKSRQTGTSGAASRDRTLSAKRGLPSDPAVKPSTSAPATPTTARPNQPPIAQFLFKPGTEEASPAPVSTSDVVANQVNLALLGALPMDTSTQGDALDEEIKSAVAAGLGSWTTPGSEGAAKPPSPKVGLQEQLTTTPTAPVPSTSKTSPIPPALDLAAAKALDNQLNIGHNIKGAAVNKAGGKTADPKPSPSAFPFNQKEPSHQELVWLLDQCGKQYGNPLQLIPESIQCLRACMPSVWRAHVIEDLRKLHSATLERGSKSIILPKYVKIKDSVNESSSSDSSTLESPSPAKFDSKFKIPIGQKRSATGRTGVTPELKKKLDNSSDDDPSVPPKPEDYPSRTQFKKAQRKQFFANKKKEDKSARTQSQPTPRPSSPSSPSSIQSTEEPPAAKIPARTAAPPRQTEERIVVMIYGQERPKAPIHKVDWAILRKRLITFRAANRHLKFHGSEPRNCGGCAVFVGNEDTATEVTEWFATQDVNGKRFGICKRPNFLPLNYHLPYHLKDSFDTIMESMAELTGVHGDYKVTDTQTKKNTNGATFRIVSVEASPAMIESLVKYYDSGEDSFENGCRLATLESSITCRFTVKAAKAFLDLAVDRPNNPSVQTATIQTTDGESMDSSEKEETDGASMDAELSSVLDRSMEEGKEKEKSESSQEKSETDFEKLFS